MTKNELIDFPPIDPADALYLIDGTRTHRTFMIARASAIEQYAMVEQALADLMAYLMNVSVDVAGVPFFKMNNARARLMVIDRLLHKKHDNKYNLFWNSLYKELGNLDGRRNLIVHWITKKTGALNQDHWSSLVGANYWDKVENAEEIFLDDLYKFILKCDFFYQLIKHFIWVISDFPREMHKSWPDICLQPITYPPPRTHPLYRNWKESGTPQGASPW